MLASFAPELAGLETRPPPGWRVALTGIGGLTSAAATARLLESLRPQRVLFIGTCGAYGNAMNILSIGDCIAASKAIAISVPEILRRAYRPSPEITRWPASWSLPLPGRAVACPPAIASDEEDAALLGRIADAENLELGGVFAACHMANIPVAAALAVTNYAGPGAHAGWKANAESASRKLAETLQCLGVFSLTDKGC